MIILSTIAIFLVLSYVQAFKGVHQDYSWSKGSWEEKHGPLDPIMYAMTDEMGEPIVIDIDLSDWHNEEFIKEMDKTLARMDIMIAAYKAANEESIQPADDSDLSVVTFDQVIDEHSVLEMLSKRRVA